MVSRRTWGLALGTLAVGSVVVITGEWVLGEWVIPRVVDLKDIQRTIEEQVAEVSDCTLRMDRISVRPTVFSGIQATAHHIKVIRKGRVILTARAAVIGLRYWPLISGRQEIGKVVVKQPRAWLSLTDPLWEHIQVKQDEPSTTALKNAAIKLEDYRISVYRDDVHPVLHVLGDTLEADDVQSEKPLALEGKIHLIAQGYGRYWQLSDLAIDRIRLNPDYLTPEALAKNTPQESTKMVTEARFALGRLNPRNTAIMMRRLFDVPASASGYVESLGVDYRQKQSQPEQIRVRLNVLKEGAVAYAGNHWYFPAGKVDFGTNFVQGNHLSKIKLSWDGPDIHLKAGGNVTLAENLQDSKANLTIETREFSVKTLRFFPQTSVIGQVLGPLSGWVHLKMGVNGYLSNPVLSGWMDIRGMHLNPLQPNALRKTRQAFDPPQHALTGRFRFNQNGILLENMRGTLQGKPFTVAGTYNWKTDTLTGGWFDAPDLDLYALSRLVRLAVTHYHVPAPVWLDNVRLGGRLSGRVGFSGRVAEPSLGGWLRFNNGYLADWQEPDAPILNDVNGLLRFQEQQVSLNPLAFDIAEQRLQASGQYHWGRDAIHMRLTGNNLDLAAFKMAAIRLSGLINQPVTGLDDIDVKGQTSLSLLASGSVQKPQLQGTMSIRQGQLHYKPDNLQLTGIQGSLGLSGNTVRIPGITGQFQNAPWTLNGSASQTFDTFALNLGISKLGLNQLKQSVLPIVAKRSPEVQTALADLTALAGQANANLQLNKSATASEVAVTGTITGDSIKVSHTALPDALAFSHLALNLQPGQTIVVAPSTGTLGPLAFDVQGRWSPTGGDLKLVGKELPISTIRDQRAFFAKLVQQPIPPIWQAAGSLGYQASLAGQSVNARQDLNQAGLSWQGGDFPVYNANGVVNVSVGKGGSISAKSENLTLTYGNSPVRAALAYSPSQGLTLDANGTVSGNIVHYALVPPRSDSTFYPAVPFKTAVHMKPQLAANGRPTLAIDTTSLAGSLWLDMGAIVTSPVLVVDSNNNGTNQDEAASLKTESVPVSADFDLKPKQWRMGPLVVDLGEAGHVIAQALIDRPWIREAGIPLPVFDPTQIDAQINTERPVQLDRLQTTFEQFDLSNLSGTIESNIRLMKAIDGPMLGQGKIVMDRLVIPMLRLRELTGTVTLNGESANLNLDRVTIPGIDARISAVAPYAFEYPVQLEDVVLQGRSVNVDSLTRFNTEVVGQRVQTGVVNQIYRPWQQGLPQVPVFFRDAQLSSDEVIFQNIIMDNFRSRFSIYPNGYLDLSDTRFVSAGGDVQGRIALNPTDNNFVTLDLVFQHVQANAIAQAMLNASNRIFGELSGVISYTTSGDTQEELFDNANGYAQILIENGRLPEIAKIETLLTAANLLRGGVLGLNLNNLFRTLIPFNTNYFARLSGSMQIAQGVMHTQNLTSDGQNLDLLIQGRIRLIDGYGNLAVTGNMSQNVSGRLGVLGKLSVGKVLRWVPLLGAMPSFTDDDDEEQDTTGRRRWRGGLLNYLPGVGYVPGLGGVAQDYSRFQVTVEGPLEDPGSVREMKWLAR